MSYLVSIIRFNGSLGAIKKKQRKSYLFANGLLIPVNVSRSSGVIMATSKVLSNRYLRKERIYNMSARFKFKGAPIWVCGLTHQSFFWICNALCSLYSATTARAPYISVIHTNSDIEKKHILTLLILPANLLSLEIVLRYLSLFVPSQDRTCVRMCALDHRFLFSLFYIYKSGTYILGCIRRSFHKPLCIHGCATYYNWNLASRYHIIDSFLCFSYKHPCRKCFLCMYMITEVDNQHDE